MSAKKDFIAQKIAEFKQLKPVEPTPTAQEDAEADFIELEDNIASDDSAQELSDDGPEDFAQELPTWKFNVIQLKCE